MPSPGIEPGLLVGGKCSHRCVIPLNTKCTWALSWPWPVGLELKHLSLYPCKLLLTSDVRNFQKNWFYYATGFPTVVGDVDVNFCFILGHLWIWLRPLGILRILFSYQRKIWLILSGLQPSLAHHTSCIVRYCDRLTSVNLIWFLLGSPSQHNTRFLADGLGAGCQCYCHGNIGKGRRKGKHLVIICLLGGNLFIYFFNWMRV